MRIDERYDPVEGLRIDCDEIKELLNYLECPNRKSVSKSVKHCVCWHLHDLLGIYYNEINRLIRKSEKRLKSEVKKNEEV